MPPKTTRKYINLSVDELIIGNGAFKLPISDGLPGQALLTDGAGNVVWQNTSGSGTVTSITAGTGLDGGTITGSGTIDLANTSVTPGLYTNADITVDAQGRITLASNGSTGAPQDLANVLSIGNITGTNDLDISLGTEITFNGGPVKIYRDTDPILDILYLEASKGIQLSTGTNQLKVLSTPSVEDTALGGHKILFEINAGGPGAFIQGNNGVTGFSGTLDLSLATAPYALTANRRWRMPDEGGIVMVGTAFDSIVANPTASEDGYSLVWKDSAGFYTLENISGGVAIGNQHEIPRVNSGGTDFLYGGLLFDGTHMAIGTTIGLNNAFKVQAAGNDVVIQGDSIDGGVIFRANQGPTAGSAMLVGYNAEIKSRGNHTGTVLAADLELGYSGSVRTLPDVYGIRLRDVTLTTPDVTINNYNQLYLGEIGNFTKGTGDFYGINQVETTVVNSFAGDMKFRKTSGTQGHIWRSVDMNGTGEWKPVSEVLSIGNTVGSGTAKSILYIGTMGELQQDNTNFVWDSTNNRLGIGTNTPSEEVHIKGNSVILRLETLSTLGKNYIDFYDNAGEKGYIGYGSTVNDNIIVANKENGGKIQFLTTDSLGATSTGLVIDEDDNIEMSALSGTGDRMVTANASGVLSTQPIPSSSSSISTIGIEIWQGKEITYPGSGQIFFINYTIPADITVTTAKIAFSTSGSGITCCAIYRGSGPTAVLVGQSNQVITPNDVQSYTMTAETGQNLSFTGGEDVVLAVSLDSTVSKPYGIECPDTLSVAWFEGTEVVSGGSFPATATQQDGTISEMPVVQFFA